MKAIRTVDDGMVNARRFIIRCSALPAAFRCGGSIRPGDIEISPHSDAADSGTAGHRVMETIVEEDARGLDDIPIAEIARRFGVSREDVQIMAFIGLKTWAGIRQNFPSAMAEVPMSAQFDVGDDIIIELTGHADVMSVLPGATRATVGDWKFSRVDGDYEHQLRGYQAIILGTYPDVEHVDGFVGWMYGMEPGAGADIESYSMDRAQKLWEWLDDLKRMVVQWDGTFRPGGCCTFCKRSHDCPALKAQARRDALILAAPGMESAIEEGLTALTDGDLIQLHRRSALLKRICKGVDEVVKKRVEAAGGRLPDGDGRELRFVESHPRVVDPILARPVIEERLTEEEIAAATEIHASRLDDAIAKKTGRGGKKAAIEELNDALKAAGAITTKTEKRLMDCRQK